MNFERPKISRVLLATLALGVIVYHGQVLKGERNDDGAAAAGKSSSAGAGAPLVAANDSPAPPALPPPVVITVPAPQKTVAQVDPRRIASVAPSSAPQPVHSVPQYDAQNALPDLPSLPGPASTSPAAPIAPASRSSKAPVAPASRAPAPNPAPKSIDESAPLPELDTPVPTTGSTDLPVLPESTGAKANAAGGAAGAGAAGGAAPVVDEATQIQQQLDAANAQLQAAMQTLDTLSKTIGGLSKRLTHLTGTRAAAPAGGGDPSVVAPPDSGAAAPPKVTLAGGAAPAGGGAAGAGAAPTADSVAGGGPSSLFPDAGPSLVSLGGNRAPMPDPGLPDPPQVTAPPETSGAGAAGGAAPAGGAAAAGGGAAGAAPDLSKLTYQVSQFLVTYAPIDKPPNPHLPPVESLLETKIKLGATATGYLAPGKGKVDVFVKLPQLTEPTNYSGDALQQIYVDLATAMNKKGVYGVLVVPDPQDIDANTGQDLRGSRKQLRVLVFYSEITQVRTIAKGSRGGATQVNTIHNLPIAMLSPLKAGAGNTPGDLLNKDLLQEYISRLNRTPGRRVDAAINAAEEPGGIVLDYIVREDKPLFAYAQISNTGTESTGEWRARVGAEYRNLAGRNDILSVDYVTDTNGNSTNLLGSYDIAVLMPNLLKLKIYASHGEFTASDVGFDLQNFSGDTTSYGAVLTYSPFSIKGYPIDFFIGAEWRDISVVNSTFPQTGQSNFFLPYIGVGTEQVNDRYRVASSLILQTNMADFADTKTGDELDALGRFNTDRDFTILKWNLTLSAFLEPIFGKQKWLEGKDWTKGKLAQELVFSTRGQYTFDDKRLAPQFEDVVGGFSSVRGYPESLTAGDTVLIGTVEYKLHLPKLLKPLDAIKADKPPQPGMPPDPDAPPPAFALRPPTSGAAGGKPDWDLIARVFVDAGQTYNNQKLDSAETDSTLASTGVGLELQISRYMNLRADWGVALIKQDKFLSEPIEVGDSRFHLSLTLTW